MCLGRMRSGPSPARDSIGARWARGPSATRPMAIARTSSDAGRRCERRSASTSWRRRVAQPAQQHGSASKGTRALLPRACRGSTSPPGIDPPPASPLDLVTEALERWLDALASPRIGEGRRSTRPRPREATGSRPVRGHGSAPRRTPEGATPASRGRTGGRRRCASSRTGTPTRRGPRRATP